MAKELLKEAIADAKAVREVALENAKMALEEAFDSKIKNMLSAKLAEELEEDFELEETYMEDEKEKKSEAMNYDEDEADEDMKEAYHEDEADEDMKEAYLDEDEEINLDELMAELDEEMKDKDKEDMDENIYEDDVTTEAAIDEDVKKVLDAAKVAAGKAGKKGKAAAKYIYDLMVGNEFIDSGITTTRKEGVEEEGVEENFDIDALIAEIEADLDEDTVDEGATGYDEKVGGKGRTGFDNKPGGKGGTGYDSKTVKKLKEERNAAIATVRSLQGTLSEMNLLNSKLLYCNKLFRANALTEAQKVKVVDALDMANTANEAKLVFSTLQESFNFTGVEKRAIKEGLGRASKASGNAPKKVITESVDETVSRFQKLANIKF